MVTDEGGNILEEIEFNAYGEKIGEKIVENGKQIPSLNLEGGGNGRISDLGGGENVPRTSISEANSSTMAGVDLGGEGSDLGLENLFVGAYGIKYDGKTNLHYMRYRWYSADQMRFLSPDLLLGINRYAYCNNNPVNFIDPLGLDELAFDGYYIYWYDDSENIIDIFSAYSGPTENFDHFDPAKQNIVGGPTVEGIYYIRPTQTPKNPPPEKKNMGIEFYNKVEFGFISWGFIRLGLEPDLKTKVKIKIYGREGGFNIHGGTEKGTSGCIEIADYTENQCEQRRFFRKFIRYGKRMKVIVDYSSPKAWRLRHVPQEILESHGLSIEPHPHLPVPSIPIMPLF